MTVCKICESSDLLSIFRHDYLPLYSLSYFYNRKEAVAATSASVNFVRCPNCGFLFNTDYHQLNYQVEYEASRAFSPVFNNYIQEVGKILYDSLECSITKIVEVGAGDCYFAKVIMELNPDLDYYAYDPSYKTSEVQSKLFKYNEYYHLQKVKPDMVVARHVLEHQSDVKGFIGSLIHESPLYVFIEIPCTSFVLNNNFHYYSYEHCSYFDRNSLNKIMNDFGYYPVFMENVFNAENIISLWSRNNRPARNSQQPTQETISQIDSYDEWKSSLLSKIFEGDIIWGAAGKGVLILNILGLDYKKMPFIVDKNPCLHGKYIPLTGNEIISPNDLKRMRPENIHVLNSLYLDEIVSECRHMDIKTEISPLFGIDA